MLILKILPNFEVTGSVNFTLKKHPSKSLFKGLRAIYLLTYKKKNLLYLFCGHHKAVLFLFQVEIFRAI
jgi:hypothetical protein